MGIAVAVAVVFIFICVRGEQEFRVLRSTTEDYISCEKAANQLQQGSNYLTEQVRLYTITGDRVYLNHYFVEAKNNQSREIALSTLEKHFGNTSTFAALEEAMNYSTDLMSTEYYAMKLVAEAVDPGDSTLQDAILETELSAEDQVLSADEKIEKAQQMVSDGEYQKQTNEISSKVKECTTSLVEKTRNRQARSASIFSDMYLKLEIGIILYKRAWKTWLSFLLKNRDKGHL